MTPNLPTGRYVVWWGYGCDNDSCVWSKRWNISPEGENDPFCEVCAAGTHEACQAALRLFEAEQV